jgi:hypothetical protein
VRAMAQDRLGAIAGLVAMKGAWEWRFEFWYAVYYGLGIGSIVLASLLASRPSGLKISQEIYDILAWILAVTTATFTFLNPGERADRFNKAWSLLNSEIISYATDQKLSPADVVDAYRRGEEIIHQTPSAPPPVSAK